MKKGFSLIELSIALVVIGVILAAVMSGGDVVNSGENKKFYQSFARKWSTIIDSYYDRTGAKIGDSTTHGGTDTNQDGYFDGIDIADATLDTIKNAGIIPTKVVSSNAGKPYEYFVQGSLNANQKVTLGLYSFTINGYKNNYIVIKDIPEDVAAAIDRYVDGVTDGENGNGINLGTDLNSASPTEFTGSATVTNYGIAIEH